MSEIPYCATVTFKMRSHSRIFRKTSHQQYQTVGYQRIGPCFPEAKIAVEREKNVRKEKKAAVDVDLETGLTIEM